MGTSFIPGLTVSRRTIIRKRRILPLKGQVLAKVGDLVKADDVVANTFLPGKVHPMNVANILSVLPSDLGQCMLKKEGDTVVVGDKLAMSKSFFGLFKNYADSKINGTLENVSSITGQIMLREKPIPVEVKAYIDGTVIEVVPDEGVIVESIATHIQGIFGIGGEAYGNIRMVVKDPAMELTPEMLTSEYKGAVVIGGSFASLAAIKKAVELEVKGLVVGGIDALDLVGFLGYDLGVAITGSEKLGLTLVVTEGFGKVSMARKSFDLLAELEGKPASINGATQIRAGVIRPEIIVTLADQVSAMVLDAEIKGVEVGDMIRIIRQPYFGEIGKVTGLPSELTVLESGSRARVLEVTLNSGKALRLPRANTEIITG